MHENKSKQQVKNMSKQKIHVSGFIVDSVTALIPLQPPDGNLGEVLPFSHKKDTCSFHYARITPTELGNNKNFITCCFVGKPPTADMYGTEKN